jgi:hypothetical protein
MTPKQIKILYDWALIHEYARGKVSAAMMEEVEKMDRALGEFCPCRSSIVGILPLTVTPQPADFDGMPEEICRFAKASLDPGCSHCWLSSRVDNTHPECQVKIKEWFDAKEALITFGLKSGRSDLAKTR